MSPAEVLDWFSPFVGGGIAVEEVRHCLVEVAFTGFGGGQRCERLALGRSGWRGCGVDEMRQE